MLFNSSEFILLYLPLVVVGFFLLARWRHKAAALWLGVASLFFYGWWNPRFVVLLLGSILFNYLAGAAIVNLRGRGARRLLVASIAADLLLLGYFKYANFFLDTINLALGESYPLLDIVLPLGISFFTFTQIAFLVDAYRGIAREFNFIHYLLFVTYFPHLIAGPVLHHKQMMPQFNLPETYRFKASNVAAGLSVFIIGLAKKVVLADALAPYATAVFSAGEKGGLTFLEAWGGGACLYLSALF